MRYTIWLAKRDTSKRIKYIIQTRLQINLFLMQSCFRRWAELWALQPYGAETDLVFNTEMLIPSIRSLQEIKPKCFDTYPYITVKNFSSKCNYFRATSNKKKIIRLLINNENSHYRYHKSPFQFNIILTTMSAFPLQSLHFTAIIKCSLFLYIT